MTTTAVVDWMRVPRADDPAELNFKNVYVVGCIDRRVTFLAQQNRAINIVYALWEQGLIEGRRIGILGAGLAGATAAIACHHKAAAEIVVLEKMLQPLWLQDESERFIHPNIYDWPNAGWSAGETALPFMNWSAGSASAIVRRLRREIQKYVDREEIDLRVGMSAFDLKRDGTAWVASWDQNGTGHGPGAELRAQRVFDVLLVTVGFGQETASPPFSQFGYWEPDNLRGQLAGGGTAFISGCGDGGLTDAIRMLLDQFSHAEIEQLADHQAVHALYPAILQIERSTETIEDGQQLTDAYLRLEVPQEFDQLLERKLRQGVSVVLNGQGVAPFARSSCALNRFLVSRLIRLGRVTYRRGAVTEENLRREVDDGQVVVSIDHEGDVHAKFALKRQGPDAELQKVLPEIWKRLAHRRKVAKEAPYASDTSRHPVWPEDFGFASRGNPAVATDWLDTPAGRALHNTLVDAFRRRVDNARRQPLWLHLTSATDAVPILDVRGGPPIHGAVLTMATELTLGSLRLVTKATRVATATILRLGGLLDYELATVLAALHVECIGFGDWSGVPARGQVFAEEFPRAPEPAEVGTYLARFVPPRTGRLPGGQSAAEARTARVTVLVLAAAVEILSVITRRQIDALLEDLELAPSALDVETLLEICVCSALLVPQGLDTWQRGRRAWSDPLNLGQDRLDQLRLRARTSLDGPATGQGRRHVRRPA